MARVPRTFADEVLWPEYQQLNAMLREHLDSVTKRVIAQAIHGNQADAEERPCQQAVKTVDRGTASRFQGT
jgi:hypothetical protein